MIIFVSQSLTKSMYIQAKGLLADFYVDASSFYFRRFRKKNSQKVLIFLAVCLLARDVVFMVGIERTETYAGCVTVAVLLHYFLLCSFAWMFVEAIIQYLR